MHTNCILLDSRGCLLPVLLHLLWLLCWCCCNHRLIVLCICIAVGCCTVGSATGGAIKATIFASCQIFRGKIHIEDHRVILYSIVSKCLLLNLWSVYMYLFQPGLLQPILPEIELLIRTWLFKYSLWDNKHTFGQQMLSLKYKPDNFSKRKLYWYYGFTIGLKYLKERSVYSYTSNTRLQSFIHKMETFQLFGDIFNFIRFIQSGKYPVLIDLILGLELTADKLTREDLTDFSWTREILWHNFIVSIYYYYYVGCLQGTGRHSRRWWILFSFWYVSIIVSPLASLSLNIELLHYCTMQPMSSSYSSLILVSNVSHLSLL